MGRRSKPAARAGSATEAHAEAEPAALLDYQRLASEFIRALRGKRSQAGFSRRLGYKSNIAYRWEAGQCWPAAAHFFHACQRIGLKLEPAFASMFQRRPSWLDRRQPTSAEALGAFLTDLKGKTPIVAIARASGINRYTLSRWLQGTSHPSLPEFFLLVDVTSRRLLDFIAFLIDPQQLPSIAPRWQQLEHARELVYQLPWAHAVLRVLQLEEYTKQRDAGPCWIAERLGISDEQAELALSELVQTGQARKVGQRWRPDEVVHLDMGTDTRRARQLKSFWSDVASERLKLGGPGSFGYSLFQVSKEDLRRLRDLHLEYVRAMQHVIAASQHTECVGLYSAQLLDLARVDNALSHAFQGRGRAPKSK